LIDTHAHIDTDAYEDDRAEVIKKAFNSGIEKIIIPAIEPNHFQNVLELTRNNNNIFCAIGIHPHNADELSDDTLQVMEQHCADEKVVAIGEIGLDYYYDFNPPDVQKQAFKKQIDLAKQLELPVIVHNREADDDVLEIIKAKQDGSLSGVLHCFSSDIATLRSALDLGFYISFTGNITFKKSILSEVVKETPMDRLLLETDSPYLTPVPFRGKRNEPANVKLIAEKISEIKSIPINKVIEMTTKNAKKLFKLATLLFISMLTLTLGFSSQALAQDEYEAPEEQQEISNPYPKGLGFGFNVGTNTIVEQQTYQANDKSISYEGIFFWGASINWSVLDFLMLEASYNYSKNTKIITTSDNLLGPNIHQVLELTSQWIANPKSRVNFYGTLGLSFFYNTLNEGRPNLQTKDSPVGFNFGLGFKINVPIANAVTIVPFLEWRLNWAPAEVSTWTYWDRGSSTPVEVKSTKFFSMPRLGFLFYPTALNFLNLAK